MKKFRLFLLSACIIACLLSIPVFAGTGFIAYNEGNNAYDGLTAKTAKKQFLTFEENGVMSVIGEEGGTLVIVGRAYIGSNYALPEMSGPLVITGKYEGKSYVNASNKTNPAGGMLKAASDRVITLGTDTTLTDMILFQEAQQNTLVVPSGKTLTITDTVELMTKPGNEHYWKIFVCEDATAILSQAALDTLEIVNRGGTVKIYGTDTVWTGNETVVEMTVNQTVAYVNKAEKALDAAPIIRNDRTMLPVRFVAEALGASVTWDSLTSSATITGTDNTVIRIVIGENEAKVNGEKVALDSPAFIENNRTYLPVRFVAEKLGASVSWNGATATATIIGAGGSHQAEERHSELYIEGLSVDDVIRYFTEVCLDAEEHEDGFTYSVRKWNTPIYCVLNGPYTEKDLTVFQSFLDLANSIENFPGIQIVENPARANLTVNFVSLEELREKLSDKTDVDSIQGRVHIHYSSKTHVISSAEVFYRTDIYQYIRDSVILEEVYQSLGIMQDSLVRDDSIVYQYSSTVLELSDVDLLLLKLLYNPKIKCGMNQTQCEYIIRELYY